MYHFFVEQEQIGEGVIAVTGPDVNHIKNVLRMKPGERVLISAKAGGDYPVSYTHLGTNNQIMRHCDFHYSFPPR